MHSPRSLKSKETSAVETLLIPAGIGLVAGGILGAASFEAVRANDWGWMYSLAFAAAGALGASTATLLRRPSESSQKSGVDAARIAHDLRSPLAALEMAIGQLNQIPEDKRTLLRSAAARIRDIANEQLRASQAGTAAASSDIQLLSGLLDSLVSEKRLQLRGRLGLSLDFQLHAESYGHFAKVDSNAFKRLVSTLIDASAKSLDPARRDGRIELRLRVKPGENDGRKVLIQVRDNGKGVTSESLAHARSDARSLGGELNVHADSRGSTLTLELSGEKAPSWFTARIEFPAAGTLVIADDDASVHQMWEGRFRSTAQDRTAGAPKLAHASTIEEFVRLARSPELSKADLFLVDYEFIGESRTGLDVIEELGLADRAILVTSRFQEARLRERCERLGVRLIPKSMAGFVPVGPKGRISITRPAAAQVAAAPSSAAPTPAAQPGLPRIDAILVDDDELVHMTWKIAAGRERKVLLTFRSVEELLSIPGLARLSGDTAIFVDSNLGNGVRGEQAAKALFEKGFRNISLATGNSGQNAAKMPEWIRRVVGKDPVFE